MSILIHLKELYCVTSVPGKSAAAPVFLKVSFLHIYSSNSQPLGFIVIHMKSDSIICVHRFLNHLFSSKIT